MKPQRLARAVVGHTLAAVSVEEAKSGLRSAPFPDALRAYFLDKAAPLPESLDIYYWLYTSRKQVVVKGAVKSSTKSRQGILGHIFKFLPLGFWLVWEKASEISIDLPRLVPDKGMSLDDMSQLRVELKGVPPINFPEAPASHEVLMMNSNYSSVATPKEKSIK